MSDCGWPRRTSTRCTLFWIVTAAIAGLYEFGNRPAARCVLVLLTLAYLVRLEADRRTDRIAERRAQFWRDRDASR